MNKIKELRKVKKITQKELAAYLNVSDNTISYWEQGKFEPSNEHLVRLADYFDCTTDYLLERDDQKSVTQKQVRNMKDAKRLVIKIGTSSLTYENGRLNFGFLEKLVFAISDIQNSGKEVILVSSGAVGVGMGKLNCKKPESLAEKQALAAIGQSELISIYGNVFSNYGHSVAQVLINKSAVGDESALYNIQNTFEVLLEKGVIPIVNENDTICIDELVFGDNDNVSAIVAAITNADLLIILTDMDGLYDKNPRENKDAKLISRVDEITDNIMKLATEKGSSLGSGGMLTKLEAAKIAKENGIDMVIMNSKKPGKIKDLLNGKEIGTYFPV